MPNDQAEIARIDRQRRERLLAWFLPGTSITFTLGAIVACLRGITVPHTASAARVDVVLLLLLAFWSSIGRLNQARNHWQLAERLFLTLWSVGVPTSIALRGFLVGSDEEQMLALVLLVLVPVLVSGFGSVSWVVGATLAVTACTSLLCVWAVHAPEVFGILLVQPGIFVLVATLVEWVLMVGLVLIIVSNQRTMQQLASAYVQAAQLDDLKDQFITHVNHELRTPIMTLHGYVEYLKLRDADLTPAERLDSLASASTAGYTLVGLLTSILDLRSVEGETSITPAVVPLRAVYNAASGLIDPREGSLEGRQVLVDIPDDLAVVGEPIRVQQVLTNILANAVKYSAPNTPIQVVAHPLGSAVAGRRRGSRGRVAEQPMVEITVRDWGLGIPVAQQPLLFHRFARLPRDLASKTVGNGLGLYFCRELVELMGGHIGVESTGVEGEGSTFIILLPQARTS
jgi:signal transduction histidine kinase